MRVDVDVAAAFVVEGAVAGGSEEDVAAAGALPADQVAVPVALLRHAPESRVSFVHRSDKRWATGCVNAAGKARQKW